MSTQLRRSACWGLFLVLILTAAARAELPKVNLADIDAANLGKGWSEVKTEGDVKFREVNAGDVSVGEKAPKSSFSVKVWWDGAALRPPENTHYVLEVKYKDTATTPVICWTYGGLNRYFGPSEVHRIGGSGDGKWKTAYVAVGWDQILRQKDLVTFAFSSDKPLPVAEVKMRLATKEDEARHNAETRAWIAQVQESKRKATPLDVKPREFKKDVAAGPVVFAWSSLVPLLQNAQPKDDQINAPIKIRTCLNMLEGGSFGVYANDMALTNVNYSVSELKGANGTLIGDVIPRTAEYAMIPGKGKNEYKWFPQRLWPAFAVDIPKGQSHWFLFNIRTHRGQTKAGTYSGTVTITCEQGKATLPVEVEVLNIDLLTMTEAKLFMGGCVTGFVPAHDIEFAVDYNQNGINLWYSGIRPEPSIKDNKLALDFTIMDEWMAAAKKRGLVGNVWFLGGNPYDFPSTATIFRSMGTIDTRDGRKPPGAGEWIKLQGEEANRAKPMPHDRELVVEWVRQTMAHSRAAGWPEVMMTPFDEPAKWVQTHPAKDGIGSGPWIASYFKDACAAIHEGDKDVKIYASIHHINRSGKNEGLTFLPDIDLLCTNAIDEDSTVGDKVRQAGKIFWQYSGGDIPDQARFGYGFYFASFGSTGSLRWAYNWGPGFDTTEGSESWMYAWETPFDTIPAPSFEGMREAWDDRRIIETYKKKFSNDAEAMAVLKKIFKEAASSRGKGGRDTVNDFYTAVDDVNKMDKWRDQLLEKLK